MRTVISSENPHGYSRYGFAWERIPQSSGSHLDFGCYQGAFLKSLEGKGIGRLVGVDVSRNAVSRANEQYPELEIIQVAPTLPLPFDDGTFDSITILDVLEHVDGQSALLDELYRILEDDGLLIVTVPGKHLFSFLDMGNFKFLFPRLHRWHYCRKHTVEEYNYRYVTNPDGLVGDISATKRWHQHFSRKEMKKLLCDSGFSEVVFDGAGFFLRLINCFDLLLRCFTFLKGPLASIRKFDTKLFSSCHLFCVAVKRQSDKNERSGRD